MIIEFKLYEDNYWQNKYKIRTKNLTINENEFILFKLKKELSFSGWDYNTDEFYIGHLFNIKIRPELHFELATTNELLTFLKSYYNTTKEAYEDLSKNKLTNMQFKLMLRKMEIYKKGTLNDIIEKLNEFDAYNKYNL